MSRTEKRYAIKYKGHRIHENLSIEECSEILEDYALKFYETNDINPNEYEIEEM